MTTKVIRNAKHATALVLCLLGSLPVWAQEPPASLDLRGAMLLALEQNPGWQSSERDVAASRAGLMGQRARLWPSLTAQYTTREQQSPATGLELPEGGSATGVRRSSSDDLSLALNLTAFQSGLPEAIRGAQAQVVGAEWALSDSRRRLLLRVVNVFHTALANLQLADIAQQSVEAALLHLELVDSRIEAGTAARADRLPVEVELAQARLEAVRAESATWQTLAELRTVLGLPPEALPMLVEEPREVPDPDPLPAWQEEALARRPDLAGLRSSLDQVGWNLRQARADSGLSIFVQGQADYGRRNGLEGETWAVAAGASFPLFDGQRRAALSVAEIRREQAALRLVEGQLQVHQEVTEAWYALWEARQRLSLAEAALAAARSSLEAARERYAAGVGTVIELTDAELSWRRAQFDLVQAHYDQITGHFRLLAAGGRDLLEAATPEWSAPRIPG